MRRFLVIASFGIVVGLASVPLGLTIAHEAHKADCNETSLNATNADIQAMPDGKAKTKARQEMHMAEEMMAKKDMDGCVTHLHNAMEAVEE